MPEVFMSNQLHPVSNKFIVIGEPDLWGKDLDWWVGRAQMIWGLKRKGIVKFREGMPKLVWLDFITGTFVRSPCMRGRDIVKKANDYKEYMEENNPEIVMICDTSKLDIIINEFIELELPDVALYYRL